ncbi:hypothetical protein [Clostridium sp.]|uniref:hypothetical protein n=1 Tax=Clostridium sp. TaxID=1506 RepID=UPI00260F2D5D|nr:hypothetical protein [Clostridium sp.]
MKDVEKAYIAGIIDGEGSIMLIKLHSNEFPSPCISIASTTLELLTYIKGVVCKGSIIKKKNYNTNLHKDSYSFSLKRNDAINLLEEIYPYLIIESKRKRAKLILEKYKSLTPRNGRYSDEMLKAKENFYNEFINIR